MQPYFPITANLGVVLAVFVVLLVLCDVLLVRILKIGKVAWKRVDYFWLGFAAIGLLAAAAQVRKHFAETNLDLYRSRARTHFDLFRNHLGSLASDPGSVCVRFVRSEFSPPPEVFDKRQKEHSDLCAWFKELDRTLPKEIPTPPTAIEQATLPAPPKVESGGLSETIDGFYQSLGYYNEQIQVLAILEARAKQSDAELILVVAGPFLLAGALALRITKVTGEIRLG